MKRSSLVITAVIAVVIGAALSLHWWRWRDCITVEEARARVGDTVSPCFVVNAGTSTLAGSFLYSAPFDDRGAPPIDGLTVFIPRTVDDSPPLYYFQRRVKVRGRIEPAKDGRLVITVEGSAQISS